MRTEAECRNELHEMGFLCTEPDAGGKWLVHMPYMVVDSIESAQEAVVNGLMFRLTNPRIMPN